VGAGGGGFLMLYCEEGRQKVRAALAKEGLAELRFGFDFEGSKVIYNI
jgi:D-glycero-alpha-D-manno-heptose-7-phosphate kinase